MAGIAEERAPGAAEAALVAALRVRDEGAFLELVVRNQAALMRLALAHGLAPAAAEAVVREAWAAAIPDLPGFDGRASLRSWLAGLAGERARARAERDGCRPPALAAAAEARAAQPTVDRERFMGSGSAWVGHWSDPPRGFAPSAAGPGADGAAVAGAALAALPPMQRAVVGLRDVEEWSAAEVCEGLGIEPADERALLHRGRAAIRRSLEVHLDGR